jgi:predicted dehydrogenase
MSPGPLRFGILGAARIAPKALIEPARAIPEVSVVAIAARDRVRARRFASMHRIARVMPDYGALVQDPKIDAVYVALPNSMHHDWAIAALRAGKHVLCEKPIAANASEAEEMAAAADSAGLVLAEAFHYRYHPLAARIRELLTNEAIGRLIRLEARFCAPIPPPNIRHEWSLAGGATMDLGCYPLNMIRCFSGGAAPRVIAAKAVTGAPKVDISMEAELELAHGATAHMSCSMAPDATGEAFFAARGERGWLRATNPVAPHIGHVLTLSIDGRETRETISGDTTFACQLRAFAAAVVGGGRIATDAAEGVINMRLIDEVYRAAALPPRGT